jgi:hypothetical protein
MEDFIADLRKPRIVGRRAADDEDAIVERR